MACLLTAKSAVCMYIHVWCYHTILPSLNPTLVLKTPFGEKTPNLMTANTSDYMVLYYTSSPGMHSAVSLVVNCSIKHGSNRRHATPLLSLPNTTSFFSKIRSTLTANPAISMGRDLRACVCVRVCVCVCVCVCVIGCVAYLWCTGI